MKMIRSIILLLCFSVVLSAKPDCNKLVKTAENCMREALRLNTFVIARNYDQYLEYKSDYSKSVKCMRDYGKCLKGLSNQVFGLVISGMVKHGKYMFGKQSNSTAFLHSVQCLNNKIMKSIRDKLFLLSARIQRTIQNATGFDEGCCSFRLMEEEVMATLNKDTCKVALNEAREFVRKMMGAFLEDASNLLCTKHTSVKVCDKDYPKAMALLRSVDPKKASSNEFIIRPMLRLGLKFAE